MSWEEKTLDELGDIGRGKSRHRPRNDEKLYGGNYPFIQTGDIQKVNLYINSYEKTYSEFGLAQSKLWNAGTLCLSIVGANTAESAILGIDACFPDSVIGFNAHKGVADNHFIKYYLDTIKIELKRISEGTARENLSMEKLLSKKRPFPPYSVQKKIASILSAYDDLIENNLKRIKLLEEAAQNIYKEWFVNFRFPGWVNAKFDEESGLPEGWNYKILGESCHLVMGQSPESEFYNEKGDGLPFHQGVTGYGQRFVKHSTYCTKLTRIANEGDILCSVRAPVGRLNISPDKIIIGRGLSAIRNKNGFQSFQFCQLKNHFYQEDMIGGGAIFNSVTKKDLESQILVNPAGTIVINFESVVKPIDFQISNLDKQIQKLKEARDILLPRLMNQTIEV